jgi:hypothetical protein
MEEILEPNAENRAPDTSAPAAERTKLSWREYLETDDAVRTIYLIFGFFAVALVMTFLQFKTDAICCGDWDGYYHIKWSSLLWENFRQGKWLPTFEWLPLTVLNPADYADHHFLFTFCRFRFCGFSSRSRRRKSRL